MAASGAQAYSPNYSPTNTSTISPSRRQNVLNKERYGIDLSPNTMGDAAGKRSAVMFTLLICARNHGVDPQAYLRDVIERLPVTRPCHLDALLPANWAAANCAAHPAIKSEQPQIA